MDNDKHFGLTFQQIRGVYVTCSACKRRSKRSMIIGENGLPQTRLRFCNDSACAQTAGKIVAALRGLRRWCGGYVGFVNPQPTQD